MLALASRQGAVVSAAQAAALGMSPSGVKRRITSGEWAALHPATYRVTGLRPDLGTELWAAQLAVPASAVTSTGALWRHGLVPEPRGRPHLVVPTCWSASVPVGVRVTRSSRARARVRRVGGLPVTSLETALLQVLADGVPDGPAMVDRALQLGRVRIGDLAAEVAAAAGSRGVARARAVVAAAADGAASEAERRLGRLLTEAGLGGFRRNLRIGSAVADLAYPDARVLIEVDGWAWHTDTVRFQRDRSRQNDLVLADWTVLRFTWRDIDSRPAECVRAVARALDRRPGPDRVWCEVR